MLELLSQSVPRDSQESQEPSSVNCMIQLKVGEAEDRGMVPWNLNVMYPTHIWMEASDNGPYRVFRPFVYNIFLSILQKMIVM